MALKPCKECKRDIAVGAKSCPHCGTAWPAGKRTSRSTWIIAGLIVVTVIVMALNGGSPNSARGTASTPRGSMPGVTRVGRAKVEATWKHISTTPGLESWTCRDDFCVLMFDPSLWSQMPYDLKRNVTAGMGMAFAVGRKASNIEIHDNLTNSRLATYDVRGDHVEIGR